MGGRVLVVEGSGDGDGRGALGTKGAWAARTEDCDAPLMPPAQS